MDHRRSFIIFKDAVILTNFVDRRRQDFHIAELGLMPHNPGEGFAVNWEIFISLLP